MANKSKDQKAHATIEAYREVIQDMSKEMARLQAELAVTKSEAEDLRQLSIKRFEDLRKAREQFRDLKNKQGSEPKSEV